MSKLITQIKRVALALCLATPIVSWADGNVAMIGETGYGTIHDALFDYKPGDAIVITAEPTESKVLDVSGTFKFTFVPQYAQAIMNFKAADGFEVSQSVQPTVEDPYFTFVVISAKDDGMVKLISGDNYKWYDTFSQAFKAAQDGDSLLLKLDGNFDFESVRNWDSRIAFNTITIETPEVEDPIMVSTYIAGSSFDTAMTAATWVAPTNVTLKLYTQTVTSVTAGTVEIPEGMKLTLENGSVLNNIKSLAGTGVVSLPSAVVPSGSLQIFCQRSAWKGTLEFNSTDLNASTSLGLLGNSDSTVRFNNCGLTLANTGNNIKALEVGDGGLELMGSYYQGSFAFPCALKGTGSILVSVKNSPSGSQTKVLNFTGDVSGFTGGIRFGDEANARVVFGSGSYPAIATAANNKQIVVLSDMALPAGATWIAPSGIYVFGGLDVRGTLTVPEGGLYGSGVIKFSDISKAVTAPDTWTGTYRIAGGVGDKDTKFEINKFGSNANATIEIVDDIDGAFPAEKVGNNSYYWPTNTATVKLSANWTISNGWGETETEQKVTKFAKLTGRGDLTVNGAGGPNGSDINYEITTLDGYTGTLGGARGKFKIGTIVLSATPSDYDEPIVNVKSGTREFEDLDQTVVKVGNVVQDVKLEQKADGIYIVKPGFDGGDGATFTIDDITQTALEAKLPEGKALTDVAFESSNMTYAQAYALGLFDGDEPEDVKVTIDVVGGKVRLGLNSTPVDGYVVTLKVFEKTSLDADWPTEAVSYSIGADITPASEEAGFYKVGISIADAVAE